MTIEKSLLAQLGLWPDIAEAVGSRITPQQATHGDALPRVTYTSADSRPAARAMGGSGGLIRAEIQFTVWAITTERAREIAALFIGNPESADEGEHRLDEFRGWMGTEAQRHWVQSCEVNETAVEDDPPAMGRKKGTEKVVFTATIFYDR